MTTPTPSTNTPQKHLAAFSSPAPRSVPSMMNFDSPAALGLSLEGGVGMGISMSGMSGLGGLGLAGSSMGGRADDEERRRRLEAVIATVGARPGRVSQEGVRSLCQRCGLGLAYMPGEQGEGKKSMGIAGKGIVLDIDWTSDTVERVAVDIPSGKSVTAFSTSAAKMLQDDLTPPPGVASINLTLDRFAHNLERLARMDRLSTPEVNCFEAISGVYTSLRRLFEHEKKAALALFDAAASSSPTAATNEKAEREVLCKKSGRPRMNAGKCVGLALEYWMDRRHILPPPSKPAQKAPGTPASTRMDIDSDASEGLADADADADMNRIYSLTIECESSPAGLYPSMRISDAWISPQVEKPASDPSSIFDGGPSVDWLEPPPTYIPSTGPEAHDPDDAMNLGADATAGVGRLPNIRFIAKLSPPLVVPLSVAVNILPSIPSDSIRPTTFEGLALRPGEADPGAMGLAGETREIRSERSVLVVAGKDGRGEEVEVERRHANALFVTKTEYARVLDEVPFSHPRQLVEILPTLRQYAFLSSLLTRAFLPASPSGPSPSTAPAPALPIDLTLHYSSTPPPHLTLLLPHPSTPLPLPPPTTSFLLAPPSVASKPPLVVSVAVLQNAEIVVAEQNVASSAAGASAVGGEAAAAVAQEVQRLGRALDLCADVGVWAEWVRGRVAA